VAQNHHLDRERERLWLDDGDFLDLDWHGPHSAEAPLVLVLHGLTGSSNSPYVAGIQALGDRGWASVALNWRGCSGEPNLLPRSYHSGASEDLAEAIRHLRAKRPLAAVCGRLFLGGNVLLKHLGETGSDSGVLGAVAVSVPFRLISAPTAWPGFLQGLSSALHARDARLHQEQAAPVPA
jgi:predicted alpha/beta-fold hydrolase